MMSDMQWTPGPWLAVDEDKPPRRAFQIIASNNRIVAQYLAFDDHLRLAHEAAEPDRVQSNARLISAAPDLAIAAHRARVLNAGPVTVNGRKCIAIELSDWKMLCHAFGKAIGE